MNTKQLDAVSAARAHYIRRRTAEQTAARIDRIPASVVVAICMLISFSFWGSVLKAIS